MNDFGSIVNKFISLGSALIPLLAVIALLAFAMGVGRFIRASSSGGDLSKSKNLLIWGVVGLLIIVSTWGIIALLRNEFGWGGGNLILPLLKTN